MLPGRRRLAILMLLWCALLAPGASAAEPGSAVAAHVARALPQATVIADETHGRWRHIQVALRDERYPLVVDLVGDVSSAPVRTSYMLPGGSQTFRASYLTPDDDNLVGHVVRAGSLVIGVTPREDRAPPWRLDTRSMAGWGMAKHRHDIRKVVVAAQAVANLPYDVLGHSYGAASALDYAAAYDDLERVIALDIAVPDASMQRAAQRTADAHTQLMRLGLFGDPTYSVLKPLAALAARRPKASSGYPRGGGHGGAFTLEGMLFSSMIDSAPEPGIATPITGLPGDWLMQRGALAGTYTFAPQPSQDRYAFTHTPLTTVRLAARRTGSGLIPVAFERDWWAVSADSAASVVDWGAIHADVLWINAELGYGPHQHGAELIRAAGNPRVTTAVVSGYGHADLLWGTNARQDVWERITR